MSIGQPSPVSKLSSFIAPAAVTGSVPISRQGEPPWELATLFPPQGEWTEEDFLALESQTGRPMELVDGCIRMLPMPTEEHQAILGFLYEVFKAFVVARQLGRVRFAPLPIHFAAKNIREPDLMFFGKDRPRGPKGFPEGADLVLEIVSEGTENRHRDLEEKRVAYANAGVPEYWVVDPRDQTITVLVTDGDHYREHGVFHPGEKATSVMLTGLSIAVDEVFAAANE